MFTPFFKAEGILDKKPFLDYEVQFNLFHRIIDGKDVVALKTEDSNSVVLQNPGHPMWLWIDETLENTKIHSIINSLCKQLETSKLSAISGKPEFAKIFAEEYSKLLSISYKISLGMEAYQCPNVIQPQNVKGKLIKAELQHTDIVADFWAGFGFWCFGVKVTKESQLPSAEAMIKSGDLFLWEVDNRICSMVNIAHRSKRYARINNVYTPPEQRKKGYASAAVAKLCSLLAAEGLIPMLYADIKNPASNNVYKSIGFMESGRIDNIVFKY